MKKKMSLNKETISRLDDAKMSQVHGGAKATTTLCISAAVTVIASSIHDIGDKKSWWHCTKDTNYASCGCNK